MKKHVKARREKLQRLGAIDAAHRCAYCRNNLRGPGFHLHGRQFCSFECGDDWFTRKLEEAGR